MSICEFSETQFSFSYVFEILEKYNNSLIPLFPTLREEKVVGYDVKVGSSLFLQFKRPVRYSETKKIYTVSLKNIGQFQVLRALKENGPLNRVFYVAPIFHKQNTFENFYLDKEIEKNSAHFPIEDFPPSIDGFHNLKYEYSNENHEDKIPLTTHGGHPRGTYGVLNSKPKSIEISHSVYIQNGSQKTTMSLADKAGHLLRHVPLDVIQCENEVETLFSTLLVKYDILWIPVR